MIRAFAVSCTLIATLLCEGSWAQPATAPTTQESRDGETLAGGRSPIRVRRPGAVGAPRGDWTAASRGGPGLPTPILFAEPDEPGLTISATPTICFFVPKATKNRAVVTLSDPMNQTTLGVKTFRDGFPEAGVYRVQIADLKEPLKPGGIYRWAVSIYSASGNNAENAVAEALVRYEPNEQLSQQLTKLNLEERARVLGESAIWYDAIAALSEAIEANPTDQFLRAQRTALLTDRKKENAASFEQTGESR